MSVKHYDWTAYHAGVRGSKVAIVDLDTQEEVTYGTLDDRANRWASGCSPRVWSRATVAVLTPNCPEVFEVEFACSKVGAICIPLNWRLTVPSCSTYWETRPQPADITMPRSLRRQNN